MSVYRLQRITLLVVALVIVPVLGMIGWRFSPGRDAFWGALYYLPLLLLISLVSAALATFIFSKRAIPIWVVLAPSALMGAGLLFFFLDIDHRQPLEEFTSASGLRGIIYADHSGEFGVDFVFAVERSDGSKVGEVYLGFAMTPDEGDFAIREVKGQLQVVSNNVESRGIVAWHSPASDRVLTYRSH